MLKFGVFGLDVCITFGFLFTVSILLLTDSPSVKFTAVSACAIHELGHFLAIIILNVKFDKLRLWAGGVSIQLEKRIISYEKELTVLASGPLLNIIISAVCKMYGMKEEAEMNLILAVFNLLPFSSLDGGCIIKTLFEYNEKNGGLFQKTAAVLTGSSIIIFSLTKKPADIFAAAAIIMLMADELI